MIPVIAQYILVRCPQVAFAVVLCGSVGHVHRACAYTYVYCMPLPPFAFCTQGRPPQGGQLHQRLAERARPGKTLSYVQFVLAMLLKK